MFYILECLFCRNLDNIPYLTYNEDAKFSPGNFCPCAFEYRGAAAFSVKDGEKRPAAMQIKQLYLLYKIVQVVFESAFIIYPAVWILQ